VNDTRSVKAFAVSYAKDSTRSLTVHHVAQNHTSVGVPVGI
jgi:hypothetical protein